MNTFKIPIKILLKMNLSDHILNFVKFSYYIMYFNVFLLYKNNSNTIFFLKLKYQKNL